MFAPSSTLYFSFSTTAALASTAFSTVLITNGELDLTIPITIKENVAGIYTASFVASSLNEVQHHLFVYETAVPATKFDMTFYIRARTIEQNLAVIRSNLPQRWNTNFGI